MRDYPLAERTIGRILSDKATRMPDKVWLLWQEERYTYADIEALTNRYANGFTARGVKRGDHVALLLPNCPAFFWTSWALGKLGAVVVPINIAAKGELLAYFLNQADCRFVIVDDELIERMAAIADAVPTVRGYFYRGTKPVADSGLQGTGLPIHALAELELASAAPQPPEALAAVTHDDLYLIMFTSGTTGPSKGVMSPHSQGHAVGRAVANGFGLRPDDILYACLPLFHGNAIWYTCYAALWADAAVALVARFSVSRFWDDIRRFGATQFNTLGAMTNIIWKLPPGPQDHLHALRLCMTVPVPRAIYTEMQDRYHVKLTSVYAMTENCAMTLFTPDDPPEKVGSAGKTRGDVELRIVGDDLQEIAAGEVGEICMRPLREGLMMKGYYKMPEATAREFSGGWFHTGDRGYIDADGYLFFVDRKKEAIRRRGENISAYEVELILSRHPAILEVAAIPVASEMSEDDVMVYVVLNPGATMSHAEVVRFANEHMSYFMVPRFVEFVAALPKTPTEKLEKYKLKLDAQERREQLWDRERAGIELKR